MDKEKIVSVLETKEGINLAGTKSTYKQVIRTIWLKINHLSIMQATNFEQKKEGFENRINSVFIHAHSTLPSRRTLLLRRFMSMLEIASNDCNC